MIRLVPAIAAAVALSACSAASDSVSNNSSAAATVEEQQPPETVKIVTAQDKAATVFFCMRSNACAVQPIPLQYGEYMVSEYRVMHDDKSSEKLVLPDGEDALIVLSTTSEGCLYSIIDVDHDGEIDQVKLEGGPKKCTNMDNAQQVYIGVLDFVIKAIVTMEASSSETKDVPDDEESTPSNEIIV